MKKSRKLLREHDEMVSDHEFRNEYLIQFSPQQSQEPIFTHADHEFKHGNKQCSLYEYVPNNGIFYEKGANQSHLR